MSAVLPAPSTTRRDLSGPALRAFFQIAQRWRLNTDQERLLLGSPARSTFFRWKGDQARQVPQDVLERISYILGIYKALHLIFSNDDQADAWVSRPSTAPLLNGQSALERMLGGQVADLFVVRQYLDAQRGWS